MKLCDYNTSAVLRVNNAMPTVRERFKIEHRYWRIQARDQGMPPASVPGFAVSHACAVLRQPVAIDDFWRAWRDVGKRNWPNDLRRYSIGRMRAVRLAA